MPAVSLVVCPYNEKDYLKRLLRHCADCYDDLVVVHDVPDASNVREVVEAVGGRFFERPHTPCQEPHWAFAWEQAAHDWILRLDADEFPSEEMRLWLQKFRKNPEPDKAISGYTCIWPMWNGRRTVSRKWPAKRNFFFNRQRVRYFGMAEQAPIADDHFEALDLILHHQPRRKTYGLRNDFRHSHGKSFIAHSLLGKPTDLSCWRWESESWPVDWEQIRRHPILTAYRRLVMDTLRTLRDQWRRERRLFPLMAIDMPVQHSIICYRFWRLRRARARNQVEKHILQK